MGFVKSVPGLTCRVCPHLRGSVIRYQCGISGVEIETEDLDATDMGCPLRMPEPPKDRHQRHRWTTLEDRYLRDEWHDLTVDMIAADLGIAKRQVRYRARLLDLPDKRKRKGV